MKAPPVFEGDTVRLVLSELTHDVVGMITQNATVTFSVYRANGSVHDTGGMDYSQRLGWNASVDMPALTADETVTVKVEVEAQGATKSFETAIPVQALTS